MTHAPTPETARSVSRRWPLISGGIAVLTVLALGLIIFIRGNLPFEADLEWMEEILENRHPLLELPALLMDFIGGGWFGVIVVPVGGIILLCILRRFWAALYFGAASIVSAAAVQGLKALIGRPRPEDMLVTADVGSFPSGHVANAATLAVVLGIIVWRLWVWVAGAVYVVLMALSRTYLGAHWVSDTIGGLILGAAVAVIVWAPLANRLRVEADSKRR